MNYFELYVGDYQRDTTDLTLIQHGAFLLLLSVYYATERPLPSDNPTLFRIARAMTLDEQNAVIAVADRFFPIGTDGAARHNERADMEITKYHARLDAASENGKKGGRPRKAKQNPTLNPNHKLNETQPLTQTISQTKALQHQHHIDQKRQNPPAAATDFKTELFARWKALPDGGGGAFLNSLFRDHKPDQRVQEAVERTLDHKPADPRAFVLGILRKDAALDDEMAALYRSAL